MTSIFIWKSNKSHISDNKITYYNGSDWFLEEYPSYSKSYKYINQYSFSTITNKVLCFEAKEMPSDWVGNHLLEKWSDLPYSLLKDDEYATLDHIGNWLRCKIKSSIEFEEKQLEEEWIKLQKWLEESTTNTIDNKQSNKNKKTSFQVPIHINNYTNVLYKNNIYKSNNYRK